MQIKTHSLILLILSLSVITSCNNTNKSEDKTIAEAKPEVIKGDALKGKELFTTCIACHGDNAQGIKKMNAPNLTSQDVWYLVRQLSNFKAGIRGTDATDTFGLQMATISKTLADEQSIYDVIAYIKTLPHAQNEQTISGDIIKGRDYYNMACSSCHGSEAAGNEMLNSPKLSGETDWYLERQVMHFKKGIRGSHPDDKFGAQMKQIAGIVQDDQMLKDIIAYINSVGQQQAAK